MDRKKEARSWRLEASNVESRVGGVGEHSSKFKASPFACTTLRNYGPVVGTGMRDTLTHYKLITPPFIKFQRPMPA